MSQPTARREYDVRRHPRVRISLFGKLRARLAGRRDGSTGSVADADGYFPYTRQLAAEVRLAEAGIDHYLHACLADVDARLAAERAAIATTREQLAAGPEEVGGALATAPESAEAIRAARVALRRRAEDTRLHVALAEHERMVKAVQTERVPLHCAARALLAAHIARHDALCAAHLRSWWRRARTDDEMRSRACAQLPAYRPMAAWAIADVPDEHDG